MFLPPKVTHYRQRVLTMERFDVIVIGTGSGMLIASAAVESGLRTAIVDFGPMGGTCENRGCIPSKMLIYPADVALMVREASKLGIIANVQGVDFQNIMHRMHHLVDEDSGSQAKAVEATPEMKWFKTIGEFTGEYTMRVDNESISAEMIFIVSGARVGIPRVKGLDGVDYLTSDSVLKLESPPKSLIIIGGGYIGVEYAHFFSGIGVKTTLVHRPERLLRKEEPEVSELLKLEMQKRIEILTGWEVTQVTQKNNTKTVFARNIVDGTQREFNAEALMVATGRVPNSDLLKPEQTGVKMDERGYIKVNEYLETSKKNIWAFGDALGTHMFKHVANYEAGIAWHNAIHDHKAKVDYTAVPHAVFCEPQVASVGLGEAEAKLLGHKILIGIELYKETAMGAAMGYPDGFVKVIVEQGTGKILGGHIIGPQASALIQEIVNAMSTSDRSYAPILHAMHIHPALPEVVQRAFGNLRPSEHTHLE